MGTRLAKEAWGAAQGKQALVESSDQGPWEAVHGCEAIAAAQHPEGITAGEKRPRTYNLTFGGR